jgi:predicted Zn-dependent protease
MIRHFAVGLCAILITSACGYGDGPVTSRESQVGAEQHPQLLAQFGGSYSGEEAGYVQRLGEKVAAAAGLPSQCTFTLVNTAVVNAFAVPGCYIYVTRGLVGIVNSEAELASVLAHELGHIAANHSERQQGRSLIRGLGVAAISAVTGSGRLSQLAGTAAALFTLRYSRKHEYEADDLGVRYLRQAGYDPLAAVGMLTALGRHQQFLAGTRDSADAAAMPEWALTHPLTEHRIARSRAAAEASGLAPEALAGNREAFLREIDGLLYGDDPAQGFVTGRRFAHPLMRIGFEAPPAFKLSNTPNAIQIDGPDGLQGVFSGGRMPAGGLGSYAEATLASLLHGAQVELGTARQTTINGLPAIIVPGAVATQQGSVGFSLAAYQGASGDAFHFFMVSKPGVAQAAAVSELYGSFRLLSAHEAASLRPRRIRTLTVAPGETLQAVASRMVEEQPLKHFLMLNGRSEQEPLRPGQLVKVVVTALR